MSVLIITSFAQVKDKIRILFLLFDFDNSFGIDTEELVFLIRNLIVGYGKLTNT